MSLVSGKQLQTKMAVCVAVTGKEVKMFFLGFLANVAPFSRHPDLFAELPVVSSDSFTGRRAKISLHSSYFTGCC